VEVTNIWCADGQTAPAGLVLGHEITGEVIEKGKGVDFLEIGDLASVPFNVALRSLPKL